MNVAFDAVVQEYVGRMMGGLFQNLSHLDACADDEMKEGVVMSLLTGMVITGAATHRFVHQDSLDEFRATERLIRNWNWMFPGATLRGVNRAAMFYTSIKRPRLSYFSTGWDKPDPNNPPPGWPD